MTSDKVPACVGVPDNIPADDRLRPVGRVPLTSENVRGAVPPEAVKDRLKAAPTVPLVAPGLVVAMVAVLLLRVSEMVLVQPPALATVTEYVPEALTTAVPAL